MNAPVEADEFGIRFSRREESGEQPGDGSATCCDQRGLGEYDGVVAGEWNLGERNCHYARECHGNNFTPGINAPPVPSQDVNRAGATAEGENSLPSLQNGRKVRGDV